MLKKWDLQKDTEKEFKRLILLQNGFKSNSGVYNLFHKYTVVFRQHFMLIRAGEFMKSMKTNL